MNFLGAGFERSVMVRRDFDPDVVHAHWWFPSGLVGSWVSSLASLPLVTSLHGADPQSGRAGSPARPLFRHVLRRSAAVTVESVAEVRRLASVLNGMTPVVAPLPFAVDLFQPAETKKNLAAVVLGDEKSIDAAKLSEVIQFLVRQGMDVAIVRSTRDAAPLRAALHEAHAGEHAIIIDGRRGDQLASTLGDARVCIVMEGAEEQRDAISAAMLCATPLAMLSDPAAMQEPPEHSRIALALDGASIGERLISLGKLLTDEASVTGQAEAARMYALATLSPESCAARMLGVYLRALGDAAA